MRNVILGAALLLASASPAAAAFVTIDLSSTVNGSWSAQSFSGIPTGATTLGGTPFLIAAGDGSGGYHAFTGAGTQTLTINTNVANVTNAYSLINTFWGTGTPNLHSVTFNATGGVSQSFTLDGNDDIRDYFQNIYTNSINGTTTQNVFNTGARRLDRQLYALSAAFQGQTLTSIVFNDAGADFVSRMVLTGLTLETGVAGVPEPATWAMMIAGFGLAGAAMRRRTRIAFA